jgi:hypothetical protein
VWNQWETYLQDQADDGTYYERAEGRLENIWHIQQQMRMRVVLTRWLQTKVSLGHLNMIRMDIQHSQTWRRSPFLISRTLSGHLWPYLTVGLSLSTNCFILIITCSRSCCAQSKSSCAMDSSFPNSRQVLGCSLPSSWCPADWNLQNEG